MPFGSQPLEEKHKLDLEKDYRIDAGAAHKGVAVDHQFSDKGEIERGLQAAVEAILGDEFFEGEIGQWGEIADLGAPIISDTSSCNTD